MGKFLVKRRPPRPNSTFKVYWRFAAERQEIFHRRYLGLPPPWTDDPIMNEYKFTNAYRASDRVSQYLIRRVIYEGDQKPEQVLFRILLFKLFNKIETWELLKSQTGDIRLTDKAFSAYERVLSRAQDSGRTLYSGAYIMPPGSGIYSAERKHQAHLKLLHHLTRGRVVSAILSSKNMGDLFSV